MTVDNVSYKWRRNLRPEEVNENKEDIRLIWLDSMLQDDELTMKIQSMLLECNPACQCYTDPDLCVNLIKSIKNEQIFLIISNFIARTIISKIRAFRMITAIFIFDVNEQNDSLLVNEDNRIVDIFVDLENLIESIQNKIHLTRKQSLGFTLFDQKQVSIRDLSKESASFLWYQLLIHILKELPQDEQSKEEMLVKCTDYYRENQRETEKIQQFRSTYKPEDAIEWYTDECFLYKLLNRALRTENFHLLYAFRSFIVDLTTQLARQSLRFIDKETVTLYRGQQLSMEELKKIKENIGILISINGFFSTSRSIDVALVYAGKSRKSDDIQSILFQIEVDRSLTSVIFADISSQSRMRDEQEVLFSLNPLFKLNSVEFDLKLHVWKVRLVATDDTSNKSQEYLASLKNQMIEYTPIIYFGRLLLIELGQVERASEYFNTLLQSLPSDHPDISAVYNGMGHAHYARNKFDEALNCFELAYTIRQKQLPSDHPHIASSLDNIANTYRQKGEFSKALEFYTQAEYILKQIYPGDHVRKARSISNIGLMYQSKGEFEIAQIYLFDALEMYNRSLPSQHPELAKCLKNIASFYQDKGELSLALDYFNRELIMIEQCLPVDHPDLYECVSRIVDIHKKMNNTDKALEFCLKKLDVQQNFRSKTHPSIARMMMITGDLLRDTDTNKALEYYQQSLSVLEGSVITDHRVIAGCLSRIACLCTKCGMLSDAIQFYQKLINLYRRILPVNHVDLAHGLKKLGLSYQAMKNGSEAARCFHESLSIYLANYTAEHSSVQQIEAEIALNGRKMTERE
ncbi:unnamed protein product [Rotaria socialis]